MASEQEVKKAGDDSKFDVTVKRQAGGAGGREANGCECQEGGH